MHVYETRDKHPKSVMFSYLDASPNAAFCSHRHVRYALFFHSLAMIACLRKGNITDDVRSTYMKQIDTNQGYIRKQVS